MFDPTLGNPIPIGKLVSLDNCVCDVMKIDCPWYEKPYIQRDLSTLYIDESYYKYNIKNRHHRMSENFLHDACATKISK
jgi:hypothetical protein